MASRHFKIIFLILTVYMIFMLCFYMVGGNDLRNKDESILMIEGDEILAELNNITQIEQIFTSRLDVIEKISLKLVTLGRVNSGVIHVQLWDKQENILLEHLKMESSLLQDGTYYEWEFNEPVTGAYNRTYSIVFNSECKAGMAPALYYDSTSLDKNVLIFNNEQIDGEICFAYSGKRALFSLREYIIFTIIIAILISFILLKDCYKYSKGEKTFIFTYFNLWKRYKFLIYQLVIRDFKTKYKRSILGYLWSFLNPLFTMIVQYIVFSTIFQSDIKNFPVYLLTGIILFNFFSESVGQGLSAIVGNTQLITKVYVPKYIYPISRVLSSSINLVISMIPLLLMVVFTGTQITKAIILLPYALVCLLGFSIGLALLLSSSMVFFRDTQYLWGIISLAWMYATPLFYPETIIPQQFKFIHKLNPLYYIIKFARNILIDGKSPTIDLYFGCGLCAVCTFIIGALVFKKTQDKFILYL